LTETSPGPTGGLLGRIVHGDLRIVEEIGWTREGPLYSAAYPDGREVAILAATDEHADRSRLRRAAAVRHPNLPRVFEVLERPGEPAFVVSECLDGELLSEVLAKGTIPSTREALDLFLQAAAGLEAAHQAGLTHANLSPETILVTRTLDGPRVKLIGFALPAALPPVHPKPIDCEVGVAYASPERLAGHVPDQRSDVYSLGAVLHHLLVGAPPGFGAKGLVAPAMRAAMIKAVFPIPEQRYQRVADFVAAVRGAAAAGPDSSAAAVARVGSRRSLRLMAGGIVTLLVGGLWFVRLQWRQPIAEAPESAMVSAMPPDPTGTDSTALPTSGSPVEEPVDSVPSRRAGSSPKLRPRGRPAVAPEPPDSSPAADTATAALTLEEQAAVDRRIGLDEAARHLGGPAHAIEGMSPQFLGVARARFPEGADTAWPLVRGVYVDPNGALILLDQQRLAPGAPNPPGAGTRRRVGDVMLFLHGDARPEVLENLAERVR
jgi:serine/threonine protein kinase